ncbi:hypothetical protein [Laspinema palackyanum]|uniref:hypothetical protein n=1 Tax=Laspinema palackyanum TaxID=3231601 RepID=UPI00345DE4EE|nr:hypothetical protein [Laspinema sp. D2c]
MPNTVLQYRLLHYLPGIGGGDRGNGGGQGGKIIGLSGVIGVGMQRAIACDRGSALGFLDPAGRSPSLPAPFPRFSPMPIG